MIFSRSGFAVLSLFTAALGASVATSAPFYTDGDGVPLSNTICGEDKMVKMISEPEDFKKMGMPIGIYKLDEGGGAAWCTGTLIAKDLFITARHCYGECSGITVTFGFLGTRKDQETFRCKEIVEKGGDAMSDDYMIVRLEGNPGTAWGWYDMADKELTKGQQLLMIHHPLASPMKVSQKGCEYQDEKDGLIEHRCDTQPGSSGSGILLPDFAHPENTRIIAIHTLGGCNDSPTSSNSGPSIHHLATISPLIKSMLRP